MTTERRLLPSEFSLGVDSKTPRPHEEIHVLFSICACHSVKEERAFSHKIEHSADPPELGASSSGRGSMSASTCTSEMNGSAHAGKTTSMLHQSMQRLRGLWLSSCVLCRAFCICRFKNPPAFFLRPLLSIVVT